MSPLARRLMWLFAIVGLAASLTSLYVHHQMLVRPGYTSFCDINSTFSCTEAYLSRYGSVRGIPVALFGVIWFVGVLVLAVIEARGPESVRDSAPGYLFAMATIGLAVILYLGYAAFFILKAVCVMCLTTYAAVIGLFIVSGIATSLPMTTLPRRLFADLRAIAARPLLLAIVLLFVAGAGSAVAFFPREAFGLGPHGQQPQATADQRSEFERWYEAQPRVTVPVSADGAAVLVVKFTDLQCPSCGKSYFDYRPIFSKYQAEYPNAVKLVIKDYPLNPECNQYVPRMVHPAACDAAVAVRLARQHDKGTALEEYFYSHQETMSPASVRESALNIGGVTDMNAQYASVLQQVKLDIGLGHLLNIGVTPTFFINGVKVDGGLDARYMDMAIAWELRKAGKLK